MGTSEDDIIRDEQERNNLLKTIADVETVLAAATPGARQMLESTVENAKRRVTTLDKKIAEAKVEHVAEVQAQAAAAATLAARETKLSGREQDTYRGFLEESYFTKKDFGRLDAFYKNSYDRLSEGGKEEMSKRFWEGVKHGEYQFGDAPSIIQRKEAERAQKRLGLDGLNAEQLRGMSDEEQRVFANAYNSNDHAEARRVLTCSKSAGRDGDRSSASKMDRSFVEEKYASVVTGIDLSSVDLKAVKLADASSPPSAASIPNVSASNFVQR